MSSRRPRRSRIYDSNYNIGENYYKSAIDRLDAKYHLPSHHPTLGNPIVYLRHSEPPRVSPPNPRFVRGALGDELEEEDLEFARDRASRAIRNETVLDQRSSRRGPDLESSFDGQVQKTLDRIQQSKKLLSTIDDFNDTDAAVSTVYKKRTVKVVNDNLLSSQASSDLTKWSKLSDYNDSESFANVRARQSAARIQEIEQDMLDRSERQVKREQRSANVRKLLADTSDYDSEALTNGVSSLKISKRVVTY